MLSIKLIVYTVISAVSGLSLQFEWSLSKLSCLKHSKVRVSQMINGN